MAGQIIARGPSTWLVRVYLGRDANGKREYLNKTVHGTKKNAQEWLTATLRDRDIGVAVKPAQINLNAYLDQWLETAAKPKVRPKTFTGYQDVLRRYVRPKLGSKPLAKVTPLDIQTLYNEMSVSPRTTQYTAMIVKQALEQARRWRMLIHNPCDGVKPPRNARKEMQVLTPEQARRFLAVARGDRHGVIFEVALTTGMRPSEYLALKWPDLDLEKGTASINRSIDFLPGGGWEFADNKTARSRRTIKLHSNAAQSLREHRRRQEEQRRQAGKSWADHDLVFTNDTGGPVDRHNLAQRHFRRILDAAGLPLVRLYDLRHTAATLGLVAGVQVKVISEMLGHASVALTLDTYSHVLPNMQEEAAAKVEALLMGEEPKKGSAGANRHTIRTQRVQ